MQRDATRAGSIQLKIGLNIFPRLYSADKISIGCCTASIEVEARGNCNAPGACACAIAMGAGGNREWCPNAKKYPQLKVRARSYISWHMQTKQGAGRKKGELMVQ